MGQYWKVVNIDKEEKLKNEGGLKLWEILSNRVAEQLVGLLMVPDLRVTAKSATDVAGYRDVQ